MRNICSSLWLSCLLLAAPCAWGSPQTPEELFPGSKACAGTSISPMTCVEEQCGEVPGTETVASPTCFPLPMLGSPCCGVIVTSGQTVTLTVISSVDCGGLSVGYSVGVSIGMGQAFPSGPCEACIPTVCFPLGKTSVTTCRRQVPIWERQPFDGFGKCWMIMGTREEIYRQVKFIPGGPAKFVSHCVDDSCFCREHGHTSCICPPDDTDASRRLETTQTAAEPSPIAISFALAQLRQGDRNNEPITALGNLCRLELAVLRRIVEGSGLASENGITLFECSDHTLLQYPSSQLLNVIGRREGALFAEDRFKDVNRDSQINGADVALIVEQISFSMAGQPIVQRADLNADGIIDALDVQTFFTAALD